MSVSQVAKGRLMDGAELHGPGTPGRKGTSLWRIQKVGRRAEDWHQLFLCPLWYGGQKSCRVGMAGPVEDILDLPLLHD